MWQRIQTIWLLLIVVLMCAFISLPVLAFVDPTTGQVLHQMKVWGIEDMAGLDVGTSYPVGVLSAVVALLAFVSLFLYKDSRGRTYQVRLGVLAGFVILGLLGYIAFAAYQHCSTFGLGVGVKFALALPFVALVLDVLAVRAILGDEMLVRMSNRLR